MTDERQSQPSQMHVDSNTEIAKLARAHLRKVAEQARDEHTSVEMSVSVAIALCDLLDEYARREMERAIYLIPPHVPTGLPLEALVADEDLDALQTG